MAPVPRELSRVPQGPFSCPSFWHYFQFQCAFGTSIHFDSAPGLQRRRRYKSIQRAEVGTAPQVAGGVETPPMVRFLSLPEPCRCPTMQPLCDRVRSCRRVAATASSSVSIFVLVASSCATSSEFNRESSAEAAAKLIVLAVLVFEFLFAASIVL